jgi:phosphotransferase system enzyme I (PtsP)
MAESYRQTIQAIKQAKSLGNAMDIVVKRVCQHLEVDACTVFILDADDQELVMMASSIANYALIVGHWSIALGKGLVSRVVTSGEPLAVTDVSEDEDNVEVAQGMLVPHYQAFLGVPISFRGEILGVLIIQQLETRRFSDGEIASLTTLSAQLASTVADAIETGRMAELLSGYRQNKKTLRLYGQGASSGVGMGQVVVAYPLANFDSIPDKRVEDVDAEITAFESALKAVINDISTLHEQLAESLPSDERSLFTAYLQMLDSNSFKNAVIKHIRDGLWAQAALREGIDEQVSAFSAMDDDYLKERAEDIRDLGVRILAHLQEQQPTVKQYPRNTILIGSEITASMLAEVPKARLKGVVSGSGSINGHVSILAKALGVPAVVGVKHMPLGEIEHRSIIVDGYTGHIYVDPNKMLTQAYKRLSNEEQELVSHLRELIDEPAVTPDGVSVDLRCNIGLMADVNPACEINAQGVGLYRSEVPFMVMSRFPTEDEQRILYRQLLQSFPEHPVVMRVLDIGGDKVLPYFGYRESNPFLGWRGIRLMLDHPDILYAQVRAMLRASVGLNNLHIMLPMVSNLEEVERSMEIIESAIARLRVEGMDVERPKIGIMVEVPAAVYQIDTMMDLVDFVSVGSNDLTQYILAVDRNNSSVSRLYEPYHPAVITALLQVVNSAKQHGKPVSLCGELAGDPVATVLLVGIGFDALSMSAASILKIKWVLRGFSQSYCRSLLTDVLNHSRPDEIKTMLQENLVEAGFGGLIRAGKY